MASLPKLDGTAARILGLVLVGVLIIAGITAFTGGSDEKVLKASFPRTVSIYEGSDVRVLGVKIGEVKTVEPAGTTVDVTMTYDPSVKVPADAKAVIVAPSVVGDRYVQLTPVYKGGPELKDGARLDTDRTAVPLELDQVYEDIDQITVALGPKGANKSGALSRLLTSTARNFGGQGEQFNTTMHNLSLFTSTLDDNKEALFGASREIERFVSALSENDQTVRNFNDSLSSASQVLADERADLAAALHNLGIAMRDVSGFVRENKDALSRNITGLVKLTDILVKQRAALDETLRDAPVALANLYHTYNPRSGTLDTRSNLGENINYLTADPIETICELTVTIDPKGQICKQLKAGSGGGAAGRAALGGRPQSSGHGHGVVVVEPIDTSLAGIVGRQR